MTEILEKLFVSAQTHYEGEILHFKAGLVPTIAIKAISMLCGRTLALHCALLCCGVV